MNSASAARDTTAVLLWFLVGTDIGRGVATEFPVCVLAELLGLAATLRQLLCQLIRVCL